MGVIEILQLIFIVLKLCGIINWGWFFVLLPLIVDAVLYSLIIVYIVWSHRN